MQIDSEELVKLLFETGFLASGIGMTEDAESIFNALKLIRPDSEYPIVGLAVTALNVGRNEEAVRILQDEALKINPASQIAKAFLGLSLKFSGMTDHSRKILEEVIADGTDEKATNMAQAILDEMT